MIKYYYAVLLILPLSFPLGGCAKSAPQNVAQCGDGQKQPSEECDEGDNNDKSCPYGATECETAALNVKL